MNTCRRTSDQTATMAGMQVTAPATMNAIAAPGPMPCSIRPATSAGAA